MSRASAYPASDFYCSLSGDPYNSCIDTRKLSRPLSSTIRSSFNPQRSTAWHAISVDRSPEQRWNLPDFHRLRNYVAAATDFYFTKPRCTKRTTKTDEPDDAMDVACCFRLVRACSSSWFGALLGCKHRDRHHTAMEIRRPRRLYVGFAHSEFHPKSNRNAADRTTERRQSTQGHCQLQQSATFRRRI